MSVDQKIGPSICLKTCARAFEMLGQAIEKLDRAFKTLDRAFESLREN